MAPKSQLCLALAVVLLPLVSACRLGMPPQPPPGPPFPAFAPPFSEPTFLWTADYENGYGPFGTPWGELTIQGGALEIVGDPTGSGRGYVQRSAIATEVYPPVEERPEILVYRLYPSVFFPFRPAPFQFSQDVWVSRELLETVTFDGNHLVVGPDVFDLTPADGGESRSALQVVLNRESLRGGKRYLRLFNKASGGTFGELAWNAPGFSAERWHHISLFVGQDRRIFLFQDGEPVSWAEFPSGFRLGTVGGHPGLYAGGSKKTEKPLAGWMLVDNFEIRCW